MQRLIYHFVGNFQKTLIFDDFTRAKRYSPSRSTDIINIISWQWIGKRV